MPCIFIGKFGMNDELCFTKNVFLNAGVVLPEGHGDFRQFGEGKLRKSSKTKHDCLAMRSLYGSGT